MEVARRNIRRSFPLLILAVGGLSLPKYDPEVFVSRKEYLWILEGRSFSEKNNCNKAIILYRKAIQANPRSTAYFWMGQAYERLAEQALTGWFQSWKSSLQGRPPELDSSLLKNYYQEGLEAYQKAVDYYPNVDYIRYQFGKAVLDYSGDTAKAEEQFLAASSLAPNQMAYRAALASCYLKSKRFGDSRKEATTALTDSKTSVQAEAHYILGRIELEEGNSSKAVEELKLSLALNEGMFICHYYLGKAYEKDQRIPQALQSYEDYIRLMTPFTLEQASQAQESKETMERLQGTGERRGRH